ncbi:MAG TPA: hypothetical protein VN441_10835 [Syntrophomonas sp.]|nr:hypothetical protein [Syntrophomonas sp.]
MTDYVEPGGHGDGESRQKTLIPKVLLIIGGAFSILLWLALLFYGFFLGGSPGPGYERMVPIAYAGVMALGFFGAVVGLMGVAAGKKAALYAAAVLGAVGSAPLFLLELPAAGIIFLLIGIAPLLVYCAIHFWIKDAG